MFPGSWREFEAGGEGYCFKGAKYTVVDSEFDIALSSICTCRSALSLGAGEELGPFEASP